MENFDQKQSNVLEEEVEILFSEFEQSFDFEPNDNCEPEETLAQRSAQGLKNVENDSFFSETAKKVFGV